MLQKREVTLIIIGNQLITFELSVLDQGMMTLNEGVKFFIFLDYIVYGIH